MNIRRHIISLALTAGLLLSLAAPAWADGVLGEQVDDWSARLTDDTEMNGTIFWTGDDYRTEFALTLAPGSVTVPVVVSGDPQRSRRTLLEAAAAMEARGLHVLGGVNGGFYTVATGEPVGLAVADGALMHDDDGLQAVGFRADGSTVFGLPAVRMSLRTEAEQWAIVAWNRASGEGFTAWTPNCAESIPTAEHCQCVFLRAETMPGLSGEIRVTIEDIREGDGTSVAVPEGRILLMLPPFDAETACALPDAFVPGREMTLETACAEGWEDVTSAVGILYPLLENGEIVPKLTATDAPRTAIGLREDGTLLLYALDGRQSGYSIGAGLDSVAERMRELGCVTAGALDGGGSTQLWAFLPGEAALRMFSHTSERKVREVANYILLATPAAPTGVAEVLSMEPIHINAVAGASLPLTVRAADRSGFGAPLPAELTFTVSEGLGEVIDGQYFAAGDGSGTVTVSAPGLDDGSIPVRIVASPEELELYGEKYGKKTESLTLDAGQEVDLRVRAWDRHILLSGNDLCYTWTLDETVGLVDETGHVTAGEISGEGLLRAAVGESFVEIPIRVWTGVPFADVPRSHPSFDAIRYVYDHGIFKGTADDIFEPETVMNRAMLVTVLWRLEGEPAAETPLTFRDVPVDEWYAGAVAWAAEKGIVKGYSAEEFGPTDDLTREQILTILHRWAGEPEPPEEGPAYPADTGADEWALPAITWAAAAQVYVWDETAGPDPCGPMDRANVADALTRYETLVRPFLGNVTENEENPL